MLTDGEKEKNLSTAREVYYLKVHEALCRDEIGCNSIIEWTDASRLKNIILVLQCSTLTEEQDDCLYQILCSYIFK